APRAGTASDRAASAPGTGVPVPHSDGQRRRTLRRRRPVCRNRNHHFVARGSPHRLGLSRNDGRLVIPVLHTRGDAILNTRILAAGAIAAACCCAAPAVAGIFSVTPVRIFMAPRDRATAITVTNEGDDELVMQADIYTWSQKPDGTDDLKLSDDLILSPPIIKIAGKSRQVVRLAMVSPPASGRQLTYRMILREIPEAHQADKKVQLQIALAFSLPVFITPQTAKRELACTIARSTP